MRIFLSLAIAVTFVLALLGPPQALAQERVISVGVPAPYQPIFETPTALVQKYLKEKEGITLKLVKHRGFTTIMASLLRGDILYGYFTIPSLVKALEQGAQVRAFAGFVQRDPQALVGPATVTDLRQFKGKKLSILSRGSLTDIALRTIMTSAGLQAGKDYDIIFIAGTPKRIAAIMSGSVDGGIVMVEAAIGLENKTGGKFKLLKFSKDFVPRMSQFILVTRRDNLTKQRDMLKLVTRYYLQAYREIYGMGADDLTRFAMGSWWRRLSPKDVRRTYDMFLAEKLWPENGGLTRDMWQVGIEHNVKYGLISKRFPYEKAIDRSILNEVLKGKAGR